MRNSTSNVTSGENCSYRDSAQRYVEDQPINSVIVSFVVGALIGFVASRLLDSGNGDNGNTRWDQQLRAQFSRAIHETLPDYVAKTNHAFTGR